MDVTHGNHLLSLVLALLPKQANRIQSSYQLDIYRAQQIRFRIIAFSKLSTLEQN